MSRMGSEVLIYTVRREALMFTAEKRQGVDSEEAG